MAGTKPRQKRPFRKSKLTGNQQVSYLLADFSDLDQVRDLAKDYQDRHEHLHLLINNAGGFFNKRISYTIWSRTDLPGQSPGSIFTDQFTDEHSQGKRPIPDPQRFF